MLSEPVNKKLRLIWGEALSTSAWPSQLPKLWPLQYQQMIPGKVLFIGLNPSHNVRDNDLLTIREPGLKDLASDERAQAVLERDEAAMGLRGGKLHSYFRLFDRFAHDGGWNHVDLLAVRHTNQSELSKLLGLKNLKASEQSVVTKQINVCFDFIISLSPPLVVVVNALASDMAQRYLNKDGDLQFDSDRGHHWATVGAKKIPWFFSGMLTGQRALDNHSLKRLIWHVRQALSYCDSR